jgi:hypothetical protein
MTKRDQSDSLRLKKIILKISPKGFEPFLKKNSALSRYSVVAQNSLMQYLWS